MEKINGYAAAEDYEVGQKTHGYGRVDIRKGRGHADGMTGSCDELYAEQFEHRADEYVAACGEDVAAEEGVVLGTAALCHVVEEGHELLDDELEPVGHFFKAGYGEDAHAERKQQQHRRDDERRDERGVDAHAEEIYALFFVQNGVRKLARKLALAGCAYEYCADEQRSQHCYEHADDYPLFA